MCTAGAGKPVLQRQKCRPPPTGIVVSPSASASPAEGTSSDSCLTFSASKSPVGLSGTPATQGLLGACSPVRLASPFLGSQSATPVLPTQGGLGGAVLLPVSFQEGRRASDTSLTQGEPCSSHTHLHLPRGAVCVSGST